ncbi:MAG: hypothetical protein ABW110_07415, partial [Steroidobacteraceae bacterium]
CVFFLCERLLLLRIMICFVCAFAQVPELTVRPALDAAQMMPHKCRFIIESLYLGSSSARKLVDRRSSLTWPCPWVDTSR